MATNTKVANASRNTPGWALDRLRADALPRMLDDLRPFSDAGIHEAKCVEVKRALKSITDEAAAIPDGGIFRKALYQHFEEFSRLYTAWNDVNGSDASAIQQRENIQKQMRAERNRLAIAHRKNSHILNRELDLKIIDSCYAALNKLVRSVPTFTKLAEAVARYFKRRGMTGL